MKYKYDEVWVVIRYGDTEFYDIYTERDEAVLAADEQNESMKKLTFYDPKHPKWEVKTLWDTMDYVRGAIEDQRVFDEFNEIDNE